IGREPGRKIEVAPGKRKRLGRCPSAVSAARNTKQADTRAGRIATQLGEIKLRLVWIEHTPYFVVFGRDNARREDLSVIGLLGERILGDVRENRAGDFGDEKSRVLPE